VTVSPTAANVHEPCAVDRRDNEGAADAGVLNDDRRLLRFVVELVVREGRDGALFARQEREDVERF
jgi:hypothetical protein